jgi:sulfite reductase alpha subunit-like flavoprotein
MLSIWACTLLAALPFPNINCPGPAAAAALHLQVLENRELQSPASSRSTRHVQLALPSGEAGAYSAGDHLEVMGNNDRALVETALKRLGLTGERKYQDVCLRCT